MNGKKWLAILMAMVLAACCMPFGALAAGSPLDPANPTTITIWNYYNGDQLAAFDALVSDFNSTIGIQQGIAVISVSQGSINNLANCLLDSANGTIGAQDLPTMAAIYAETASILDKQGLLVDMDDYFTADELAAYVPGFIEEGRMTEGGPLMLFPVSKSTECFAANVTDWADFAAATGITADSINTYEELTSAAEQYYLWTDGLTPDVPEDGKALYGRDSVANYIYNGSMQLGHDMFTVKNDGVMSMDLDRNTFKTLWDNYYIPYINGYFTAMASYRSEDMKTAMVLAMTGSTSGISYLPTAVTDENDMKHDIELVIKRPLYFANGQDIAVQQGAGYCIIKSDEKQQYAAAEFLKWFTDSERNLLFSVSSGYSAVTLDANNADTIRSAFVGTGDSVKDQNILNALLVSADVYLNLATSTNKPFEGSMSVRDVLSDMLSDIAVQDRAAVVAAIAEGQTRTEAVAPYTTDEYFDAWFEGLCEAVTQTVGE